MQAELLPLSVKLERIPLTRMEQDIHAQAVRRAEHHRESEAELLNSIDEVDRLKIYEKLGYPNISRYCREELRFSDTMIGYFVGVARKSRQAPALKEAIEQGELSVSTAAQITSVINRENQKEWVETAKTLTKREIEKKVSEANPKQRKRPRLKSVGPDRSRIEFEQSDEFVEFVRRAQDLESQRTGLAMTLEETMLSVFEFYLEHRDPVRKAKRAKVRAEKARSRLHTEAGGENPSQQGRPAAPTRQRPPLTAEMRHALNLRDLGRCQAILPNGTKCAETRWLEFHHLRALSEGGSHAIDNLITLCGACHRRLHEEVARLTI